MPVSLQLSLSFSICLLVSLSIHVCDDLFPCLPFYASISIYFASIHQWVYIAVLLSIHLSISLSFYHVIYRSSYPFFIYPCNHPLICPPFYVLLLSIPHVSPTLFMLEPPSRNIDTLLSAYLSVCLSACLPSIWLSVCLSTCFFVLVYLFSHLSI